MNLSLSGLFDVLTDAGSWVLGKLRDIAGTIVGKVLSFFGLTMISFNAILPDIKAFLMGLVGGLPAPIKNLLGALGVDVAMTMICSALVIRLAWKVFIIPKAAAAQIGVGS